MRSLLLPSVLLAALLAPAVCSAESGEVPARGGPGMFAYGFRGLWTGAEIGLAAGFLATGDTYESDEWRKLVLGAGIGAVSGVGVGVVLALVDTDRARPPYGWLVLRDMGYGSVLGALTGMAVGALVWVDGGRSKDLLTGASIGTLIGAGVGIGFGIVEGASMSSPEGPPARGQAEPSLRLGLSLLPSSGHVPGVGPAVSGRF